MKSLQRSMSWLLPRLGLGVLIPLVLLGMLEGILRLSQAGLPTSFLVREDRQGVPHWVNNPFYGYRFFHPDLARNPAPIVAASAKPANTLRVVVLGESAAQGDPQIEFSLARVLEKTLNHNGSSTRFEVINAAMTAINSHILVDIASELHRLEPDYVILYIGNNEVIGPFGPGTTFTAASGLPRWIRLRVRGSRLHVSQLLRQLIQRASPDTAGRRWQGLDSFRDQHLEWHDPALDDMYAAFQRNLEQMIEQIHAIGAKPILCTVAVNLEDCAPFGSRLAPTLSSAQRTQWHTAFETGMQAARHGDHNAALRHYGLAARLDDGHAELIWLMAHSQAAQGDRLGAYALFQRARDLDTQRFRADSRINDKIRSIARQRHTAWVDIDALFETVPDQHLFLDHVHFTLEGVWRLARAVAAPIHDDVYGGAPPETLPSLETIRDRVFFTPWSQLQQAVIMNSRRNQPPFVHQLDNKDHLQRLEFSARASVAAKQALTLDDVERLYRENRRRDPDDLFYPFQWGAILRQEGRPGDAAPVLTEGLQQVIHQFEMRKLPAYSWSLTGESELAAEALIGPGPPFGGYLAALTEELMLLHIGNDQPDTARDLGQAVLNGAPRFSGRNRIQTAVERLK